MKRFTRDQYDTEKVDAYEIAIACLRQEESSDLNPDVRELSRTLKLRLAVKLRREIQRWINSRRKKYKAERK